MDMKIINNKKANSIIKIIIAVIVIIFLIGILGPWYTLQETEYAVVTMFGKVKRIEDTAGLKWKIPLIEKINKMPKYILEWDGEVKQFPTYDKRMILVDATVRWKINNPQLFFESLTNETSALGKLDDILDASSREVVSKHIFEEVVRSSDRINNLEEKTFKLLIQQGFTEDDFAHFPKIETGRSSLNIEMKKYASGKLTPYGIEVIDFFVRKVNYINENLPAVYDSMKAERNKIAQKYRSEGETEREVIIGNTERDSKRIMAEAQEKAKIIRGEADAEATKIYSESYNRSPSSRNFYEFVKKMEMYEKISPNTSLIISTDSDFFDMLKKY